MLDSLSGWGASLTGGSVLVTVSSGMRATAFGSAPGAIWRSAANVRPRRTRLAPIVRMEMSRKIH